MILSNFKTWQRFLGSLKIPRAMIKLSLKMRNQRKKTSQKQVKKVRKISYWPKWRKSNLNIWHRIQMQLPKKKRLTPIMHKKRKSIVLFVKRFSPNKIISKILSETLPIYRKAKFTTIQFNKLTNLKFWIWKIQTCQINLNLRRSQRLPRKNIKK